MRLRRAVRLLRQVCTLSARGADGYAVVLDGTAVATAALSVAVQVLDVNSSTYVTPASGLGNPAPPSNPVSVATSTIVVVQIPAGFAGVQVTIPSFGNSTGTFRASITAY